MIKRKIDYRHYICVVITVGLIAGGVFAFPNAFGRLCESLKDFGLSVAYLFCEMFGIDNSINPTVNSVSQYPFFSLPPVLNQNAIDISFPANWQAFKDDFVAFWKLFGDMDNFMSYLQGALKVFVIVLEVVIMILPFLILIFFAVSRYTKTANNDYNMDSKALKCFKRFNKSVVRKISLWCKEFFAFLSIHKVYYVLWICYALLCFNLFAVVIEFFAFYFYFIIGFDVGSIFLQFYKLFLDLYPMFDFVPIVVWVLLGFCVFVKSSKNIAYNRFNHFENKNCGFINERPIVFMLNGTMGKRKTTLLTDMALSQEKMLRDKAFELILENDLKFPSFPWINLENELKRAIKYHQVYNLATVRAFIDKKHDRWEKFGKTANRIFDYDCECGVTYDNGLYLEDLWETLRTYSQLYFIYIVQSSLIISNYSVRIDSVLADMGNFPLWNSDFFKRDSRLIDAYSRHAHILDFDAVRLGRKLVEDNVNKDAFEFGVVLITEIGKERGNAIENVEKRKLDVKTNQKNDGFDKWLKMIRHSATVANFPFVRVIADEQRSASLGADARELCDIVKIDKVSDVRLALPFFGIFDLLCGFIRNKFESFYYQYRYVRSDNSLFLTAFKTVTACVVRFFNKVYNNFGYRTVTLVVEGGTQDGNKCERKYYLMNKKIYSKRFSTDCFAGFFTEKSLRSSVGIDDLQEYQSERATFAEMRKQNSYFVGDLFSGLCDVDENDC